VSCWRMRLEVSSQCRKMDTSSWLQAISHPTRSTRSTKELSVKFCSISSDQFNQLQSEFSACGFVEMESSKFMMIHVQGKEARECIDDIRFGNHLHTVDVISRHVQICIGLRSFVLRNLSAVRWWLPSPPRLLGLVRKFIQRCGCS
jgi:hypothetical protein